jgi:cytochrome P450
MILMNLRSVHMDPTHWGDPENYRPERFISPEGKFEKDDHLMLFGSGKDTNILIFRRDY